MWDLCKRMGSMARNNGDLTNKYGDTALMIKLESTVVLSNQTQIFQQPHASDLSDAKMPSCMVQNLQLGEMIQSHRHLRALQGSVARSTIHVARGVRQFLSLPIQNIGLPHYKAKCH